MIGKLVITAIVLGSGAFLLLSDSFEIFISPFASAAASDIENMQNDPVIQSKFSQAFDAFYENLGKIQFSISDFFRN